MAPYRLTIDTGGTFSDFLLLDEESGAIRVVKVPSTPDDPARAVLHGLDLLAADGVEPGDIAFFFHGTTVATNALLEERGARVGLLITDGFRGIHEAMEQSRPSGRAIFDLGFEKPALLAPQSRTAEVRERIGSRGQVVRELAEEDVEAAIELLEAEQVEAVAVCLLFSFMNPAHERRVRDLLRTAHPEWRLSVSSDLAPRIREYPRLSTTVINAYVAPVIGRYCEELERRLDERGVAPGRRFTMQSNGGSTPFSGTVGQAVGAILSGPAGGVTAGAALARAVGARDVITFDMGGTSCDVALIADGLPATTTRGVIGGRDVALPMLDINTVSAGGGTIAHVDEQGALHLGPESAGANPGPACYGRGGSLPTVTDADVVLGYLSPTGLLGGSLSIDAAAAERAVVEHVARPLGVDLVRAADGIVTVVNVAMAEAIKAISTHRGFDVRDFTLIPFGGAGPVHACRIAVDLGIRRVIVPPTPGVFSAQGLLLSDVRHDHARSRLEPFDDLTEQDVSDRFGTLLGAAAAELASEGFGPERIDLRSLLEMRYAGQGSELAVPVDRVPLAPGDLARCRVLFDEVHARRHGHAAPDQPVEVVTYRVEATGHVPSVAWLAPERATTPVASACIGRRPALFASLAALPRPVPVYDRARLRSGHRFGGPAIVEQYDATTVVCPEQEVLVDGLGNLVVSIREAGS